MEVGSGLGNISGHLSRREILVVSDIHDAYMEKLQRRFAGNSRVRVVRYDLNEGTRPDLRDLELDTVICLNVLEHIEDDDAALRGLAGMLQPHGNLILLVPAHPFLYSPLDRNLDHFRRYRRGELHALLERSGFTVKRSFHFNMLGALGWWFNGRLLRRKILPGGQLRLFNLVARLVRVEGLIPIPFGLSLVVTASRAAPAEAAAPPAVTGLKSA
jgi:SAM-dependent methyltransferase